MAKLLRLFMVMGQVGVLISIRPCPSLRAPASLRLNGSGLSLEAASFAGAIERRRWPVFITLLPSSMAQLRSCCIGLKPGSVVSVNVKQLPAAVSYFFVPASREGIIDGALIPSLVRSRMPGQTNDTALYYFIRTVNACKEVRREAVEATKGEQCTRPIIDRDLIPSLARFRMPFRTVEGDGMSENFGSERRGQSRAAHTEAVPASLQSQHRARSIIQASALVGPQIKDSEDGEFDETHEDYDRDCCVCQERFQSDSRTSGGTLRVQLLTCGHVFCVSCVARVLTHQGTPCAELCRSAGVCNTCTIAETPSSTRSECKGWAPCPLCRRLYSQDQVSLLQTHASSTGWWGGECMGGRVTSSAVADAVKYALECVASATATVTTGGTAVASSAATVTSYNVTSANVAAAVTAQTEKRFDLALQRNHTK